MLETKTIPMLRIFDKSKAIEFYVNWLGFSIDWEHTFSEGKPPVYMQVSKSGIVIHLTEHHGDCTPGGKVYIECKGLQSYHKKLIDKRYAYNAPGLETAPWKSLCMEVVDPFGNKLLFSEAQ
ncbi:MAG: VOC family protein [Bacteroidetes bacterium]|nr:VOC family protein [Bacteroidota bacterium]